MSQRPFRFLHAADLHLDQPISGVPDAPDELVDLLIDCPRKAAGRVFDAAISQRVDFVVLAGDVIDPQWAAPRDWLFLIEQFERLAEHNISVYWAGGSIDSVNGCDKTVPEKGTVPFFSPGIEKLGQSPTVLWPDFVRWPANVRYFPPGRIERYRFEGAGSTVCEIVGAGHGESGPPNAYEFSSAVPGAFAVAAAHAKWSCSGLQDGHINYWALGGVHGRSTPLEVGSIAHFAGTPQGRSAAETGPHGCTIVSVDEHARIQLTGVDCDVVRWQAPRLSVADSIQSGELAGLLRQRMEQVVSESPGVAQLISWKIECGAELRTAIRREELAARLIGELRTASGHRPPPCWTVALEAESPKEIPIAWHDEDTLRGDFLRELRDLGTGVDASTIEAICRNRDGSIAGAGSLTAAEIREIQSDAARLGADLLSPQEAAS